MSLLQNNLRMIAFYKDGNFVEHKQLETLFDMPGRYFVFTINPENLEVSSVDGIQYYFKPQEPSRFRVGDLELLSFKKTNIQNKHFEFILFDHRNQTSTRDYTRNSILSNAFAEVIKLIWDSHTFASLEQFLKVSKIAQLEAENLALRKAKSELEMQILTLKNNIDNRKD